MEIPRRTRGLHCHLGPMPAFRTQGVRIFRGFSFGCTLSTPRGGKAGFARFRPSSRRNRALLRGIMRQYTRTVRNYGRLAAAGILAAGFATGTPAQNSGTEDVVWLLRSEGYEITEISRTLLGRIRIAATNGTFDREVIISRSTGEIRYDGVSAKTPDAQPTAEGPGQ